VRHRLARETPGSLAAPLPPRSHYVRSDHARPPNPAQGAPRDKGLSERADGPTNLQAALPHTRDAPDFGTASRACSAPHTKSLPAAKQRQSALSAVHSNGAPPAVQAAPRVQTTAQSPSPDRAQPAAAPEKSRAPRAGRAS